MPANRSKQRVEAPPKPERPDNLRQAVIDQLCELESGIHYLRARDIAPDVNHDPIRVGMMLSQLCDDETTLPIDVSQWTSTNSATVWRVER